MARKSSNSKLNFLAATTLTPNSPSKKLSLQDQLIETRLRIEQAKLAQLEADIPDKTPKTIRWVDMPPPSSEDIADFHKRFEEILETLPPDGPEKGQTVQDWLIAQGAVIPDLPEWKTPLYLEKF